uniref:Reticulocalbin-3 n=1 Tax=Lepeophtheirus salmonis TaxID=72036 RepID=D3PIL6_LEPSM|nr:Calumenin-A [Lepeophtheirus salmonis]
MQLNVILFVILIVFALANEQPDIKKQAAHGHKTPEFDQEQFLGPDEKKEESGMSKEEATKKLEKIFVKVDVNGDGEIDKPEMTEWIMKISKKFVEKDTNISWNDHHVPEGHDLTWDLFLKLYHNDNPHATEDIHKNNLDREGKRWKAADKNKDGNLNKEEFAAFLHPEEFDYMRELLTAEAMQEMDKNKDNFIDMEEYMSDMGIDAEHKENSEWIEEEKKTFKEKRDKNQDGKMDFDELKDWIAPPHNLHASEETDHLFKESDDNKDKLLSREEVFNHHELFSSSHATDFGREYENHDEL